MANRFFNSMLQASGVAPFVETFTTPGASTWISPVTGNVLVECWGGGGGGAGGYLAGTPGGGGGAGGGGYAASVIALVATIAYPYDVGAGGDAGGAAENGVQGTDSSWQEGVIIGRGGSRGLRTGAGGAGGGGEDPNTGDTTSNGGNGANGTGAASFLGGGGGGGAGSTADGANASGVTGGAGGTGNPPQSNVLVTGIGAGTYLYAGQLNGKASYTPTGAVFVADGIIWADDAWRIQVGGDNVNTTTEDTAYPWQVSWTGSTVTEIPVATGGGQGGTGGTDAVGTAGAVRGGGGGGGSALVVERAGGAGADGMVRITFPAP